MKPDITKITIKDNRKHLSSFIPEMLINPRVLAHKWSKITNQTPNLKIGYPAQHLASLIVGMKGDATGARGNDICDGSEVKACSKIDQSDKCKKCHNNVLRSQKCCPMCSSTDIQRNNDSKWLIGIRNEAELRMTLDETPRFIFIVTDYPEFDNGNFDTIRIRAFEIYPQSSRHKCFRELLESYFRNLYLAHIKKNAQKAPAPKNLFPDNYPFFKCNPIKIFESIVSDSLGQKPKLTITHYVKPDKDRSDLPSELMPKKLLSKQDIIVLERNGYDLSKIDFVDEKMRELLPLRDTDKVPKIIGNKSHKKILK